MKSHKTGIVLVLAGLVVFTSQAIAQRGGEEPQTVPHPPSIQFGVYGGGALAPNSAEFSTLPGILSCQGDSILYAGSAGGGFAVAAVAGLAPGSGEGFLSHLGANLKIGLSSTSSTFEADEHIGQSISPTGEVSEVISHYTITSGLSTLIIEPTATYRVSAKTPLMIGLGPTFGLLMGATFEQKEEIGSGQTYSDGRTERNVRSGDLEETSAMLMGGILSIAYDIKVSPLISIRPEISGTLGFNGPVSDADWTQHTLRGGISILFTPVAAQSTPLGD